MGKPFLYRCPVTGLTVQGMTTDDETSGGVQNGPQMVECLACGGFHLVDPSKGPKPPADPE